MKCVHHIGTKGNQRRARACGPFPVEGKEDRSEECRPLAYLLAVVEALKVILPQLRTLGRLIRLHHALPKQREREKRMEKRKVAAIVRMEPSNRFRATGQDKPSRTVTLYSPRRSPSISDSTWKTAREKERTRRVAKTSDHESVLLSLSIEWTGYLCTLWLSKGGLTLCQRLSSNRKI